MGTNSVTYKTLFELSILHGYFLNSGETDFKDLVEDKQKKLLKDYSYENFIEIVPSEETSKLLRNKRSLLSKKSEKINVGVPISNSDPTLTFIDFELDKNLVFIIKISDSYFENYTDINLSPNRIFYFTNVKPSTEPNSFKTISHIEDSIFVDDDFKANETTTSAVLSTLTDNEKLGLLGVISLTIKGDSLDLSLLDTDKKFIFPTPKFKIHFNNRKTFWKYIKASSNLTIETLTEKPLSKNGFIEILPADLDMFLFSPADIVEATSYIYPNPSVKSIKKVVSKIYSEIFI